MPPGGVATSSPKVASSATQACTAALGATVTFPPATLACGTIHARDAGADDARSPVCSNVAPGTVHVATADAGDALTGPSAIEADGTAHAEAAALGEAVTAPSAAEGVGIVH